MNGPLALSPPGAGLRQAVIGKNHFGHRRISSIHGGDLQKERGNEMKFFGWFLEQNYQQRILVGGNHDNFLTKCSSTAEAKELGLWNGENYDYLCDSGTEFEGLKIWGSPWTVTFPGINPNCTAFTGTEEELETKFKLIPDDTNILITHGPPYRILDSISKYGIIKLIAEKGHDYRERAGSRTLSSELKRINPKVHIFGHIHECYGFRKSFPTQFVNCSHVNERYEPVNKPIRIEL